MEDMAVIHNFVSEPYKIFQSNVWFHFDQLFLSRRFLCKYGKPNLNNLYKSAEIKADRRYVEQLIIIQKQFFFSPFWKY
jgi:hypothetical protein